MGWFSKEEKPKEGDVYWLNLPEGDKKIKAPPKHPCVVTGNNEDNTSRVVGCSSKEKAHLGDIKIETVPKMDRNTYARVYDKERDIDNKEFNSRNKDSEDRICINVNDIQNKIKDL